MQTLSALQYFPLPFSANNVQLVRTWIFQVQYIPGLVFTYPIHLIRNKTRVFSYYCCSGLTSTPSYDQHFMIFDRFPLTFASSTDTGLWANVQHCSSEQMSTIHVWRTRSTQIISGFSSTETKYSNSTVALPTQDVKIPVSDFFQIIFFQLSKFLQNFSGITFLLKTWIAILT